MNTRQAIRWSAVLGLSAGLVIGAYLFGASHSQTPSLASINSQVNHANRYGSPLPSDLDGVFDCENYAREKRAALVRLGWPARDLMVRAVMIRTTGARLTGQDRHAVLLVRQGAGFTVLDNRFPQPVTIPFLEARGYAPMGENAWWPSWAGVGR